MRPKGTITYQTPTNPVVEEAVQWQKDLDEVRRKAAEARANRPLLNKHTYAWLYEEYEARVAAGGTRQLPHCKRCDATIHWDEPAHECPGFTAKYPDWDAEKRAWVHEYTNTAEGYVDWDDDQYDPSADGVVEKNPDEEDSGCIIEGMTEDEWLERKFGRRRT
jgi:hypothetical protein